jgi:hypothetical protein
MAWRLALIVPVWIAKSITDAVWDRVAGPPEPFHYQSTTTRQEVH